MTIYVDLLPKKKRGKCPDEFKFGGCFSDHMFSQEYEDQKGWINKKISPLHNINLHPSATSLNYSQQIFEGLKAYRGIDGAINLFRHDENVKRFNKSARRLAMPEVEENEHREAIETLVYCDRSWVPINQGESLYIRPTMIATSANLMVEAALNYLHYIYTSPARTYFSNGLEPISVKVEEKYVRAVRGGTGNVKTGGNYSASMRASGIALKEGYSQVLWLDAVEGKYIEEVGAMNICFVYENQQIRTPKLTGSILAGITRDSILKIAPLIGYSVREIKMDIHSLLCDMKKGIVTEIFACGTAAVVTPINNLGYKGKHYKTANQKEFPVSTSLYNKLVNIQHGIEEDPFNWINKI